MALFFVGLLLGVLLGWLTLWSYLQPAVGRFCVRLLGVAATSLGVALLVWAIVAEALRQRVHPVFGLDIVHESSEALALGSGFLVAGVTALVLSFLGRKRAVPQQREHDSASKEGT
jgi:hypothetical protein